MVQNVNTVNSELSNNQLQIVIICWKDHHIKGPISIFMIPFNNDHNFGVPGWLLVTGLTVFQIENTISVAWWSSNFCPTGYSEFLFSHLRLLTFKRKLSVWLNFSANLIWNTFSMDMKWLSKIFNYNFQKSSFCKT